MKIYFSIHKNAENTDVFEQFKETLQSEIEDLGQNGYWGEGPKIEFEDHQIHFGYPFYIAESIFSNSLNSKCLSGVVINGKKPAYGNVYSFNLIEQNIQKLVQKRIDRIENFQENHKKLDLNYLPSSLNQALFEQLSEQNFQGIILGEAPHGSAATRTVLLEAVEAFRPNFVGLEGFIYKFHQPLFDEWCSSQKASPPIELEQWAKRLAQNPQEKELSYLNLIKKLKGKGVQILALDHYQSQLLYKKHSYVPPSFPKPSQASVYRLPHLNLQIKNIIDKKISAEDRYILFVGDGHAWNLNFKVAYFPEEHGSVFTDPLCEKSLKQLLKNSANLIVNDSRQKNPSLFFNEKQVRQVDRQCTLSLEADIFLSI